MATYPTSVESFATRSAGQSIGSAHMNNVQAEITAIEDALLTTGLAHDLKFASTYGIDGTTTNDAAAAGNVGEQIISTIAQGSAVSLTSTVAANVTSISLTAGDWDVSGALQITGNAATTFTYVQCTTGTTSATLGTASTGFAQGLGGTTIIAAIDASFAIPVHRVSVSATTTLYLVTRCSFGVSTASAYGVLRARRVR